MKTVVITGGTDGIGKGLAIHHLKQGDRVIVIGNSAEKAPDIIKGLGDWDGRFTFLQADLSLVSENMRIITELEKITDHIDLLFLCAYKFNQQRRVTKEGLEFMFALHYLSRYILSLNLIPLLAKAEEPIIVNISGAGMNGKVQWNDLQSASKYNAFRVTLQNSHLNDILGSAFSQRNTHIKYVLFNPVFVKTSGLLNGYKNPIIRSIVRILALLFAKSVSQTVSTLVQILAQPSQRSLVVYKQKKEIQLTTGTVAESPKLLEATSDIMAVAVNVKYLEISNK